MRKILKLDLHSRRVCLLIETKKCCGEIITDIERFTINLKKDSINDTPVILTYSFFDTDDEGRMCILLDECMKDVCSGRYVFEVLLDECMLVSNVKMMWGSQPVITDIKVESSSAGDCYDETGQNEFKQSPLVKGCCTACDKGEKCERDPCADEPVEFCDPTELLKRDCC